MKKIIYVCTLIFGFIVAQEFEIDGNLRVQGDIIFGDESTMASASSGIPTGVLIPFAGTSAPNGWLLCDGSAISRSTYSGLYTVIATNYGSGDGSTTFNLPDLRGRTALGLDNMGGVSANRVTNDNADIIGGADGAETHILTEDEMAIHSHTLRRIRSEEQAGDDEGFQYNDQYSNHSTHDYPSIEEAGGDQPHNNMPPYMALSYIIKY